MWRLFLFLWQNPVTSMAENKFKVGDRVVGNDNAYFYAITKRGWVGTVSEILSHDTIRVANLDITASFEVQSECFDLLEEGEGEEPKKLRVGDIVRFVGNCKFRPDDLNSLGTVTQIDRGSHPYYLVEWHDCVAMNREGSKDAWYDISDLELMEKEYVTDSFYE